MRHRPKDPLKLFEIRPPITYSRMQETSLYASKTAITAGFVISSSFLTTSDRPTVQTSVQAARKQSSKTPLATLSAGLISRVRWSFRWSFRWSSHQAYKNEKDVLDGHLDGHFWGSFYGICLGVWVEIPPFSAVLSGFAGGLWPRHSILYIYIIRACTMGYPYFGVSDAPKSVCAAFGSGRSCAFNMSDDCRNR